MSGIIYFWVSGSWVVAAIIFIASFVVPLFKLAVMMLLLITVQRRSQLAAPAADKTLPRVEVIGRWSMLDVFVVSLLTGLVQIDGFATVHPGPGIAAFAAVVILTMLASMSFDPRLLWDAATNGIPRCGVNGDRTNEAGKTGDAGEIRHLAEPMPAPEKARQKDWVPSLIWLIPILAAIIGISLAVNTVIQRGPEITIMFSSARGLEAGNKTKVKYKESKLAWCNPSPLAKTALMFW